ncbi:hypothetical protein [Streptomyces californicus]|uniref:hypothetical protein n=1 Tax=Streptomyces californicus TaxID=67351 RepID=UPI00364C970D
MTTKHAAPLPALPLFDPGTERPPFGAAELYLDTPTSIGILYLAGILEDQPEYVEAIDTAWAEAREAALRCLRENVMLKVGYHSRLPSGRSVGVFTPGRLYLTAVSHPQASWKGEWQGDVARLHDHIYIGPEGIAAQDGQHWPVDLHNLRTQLLSLVEITYKDALQQSLRASLNLPFGPSGDEGYSELDTVSPDLIAAYPRLICRAPRHGGIRWIVREQVRPWLRYRDH